MTQTTSTMARNLLYGCGHIKSHRFWDHHLGFLGSRDVISHMITKFEIRGFL